MAPILTTLSTQTTTTARQQSVVSIIKQQQSFLSMLDTKRSLCEAAKPLQLPSPALTRAGHGEPHENAVDHSSSLSLPSSAGIMAALEQQQQHHRQRLKLYNYALSIEDQIRSQPEQALRLPTNGSSSRLSANTTPIGSGATMAKPTSARPFSQSSSSASLSELAFDGHSGTLSENEINLTTTTTAHPLSPAFVENIGHFGMATASPRHHHHMALSMSLFPQRIFQTEEPKPQYSYIGLIAMAILKSSESKLVLSDIYQHILENYPYFRSRGPGWRNSIRHNLSLNDCFIKSGRSANGKGHYWAVHPANLEDFRRGDFRRRKAQRKVRKHMGLVVDDGCMDSPSPPPIPSPIAASSGANLPNGFIMTPNCIGLPNNPYNTFLLHQRHHNSQFYQQNAQQQNFIDPPLSFGPYRHQPTDQHYRKSQQHQALAAAHQLAMARTHAFSYLIHQQHHKFNYHHQIHHQQQQQHCQQQDERQLQENTYGLQTLLPTATESTTTFGMYCSATTATGRTTTTTYNNKHGIAANSSSSSSSSNSSAGGAAVGTNDTLTDQFSFTKGNSVVSADLAPNVQRKIFALTTTTSAASPLNRSDNMIHEMYTTRKPRQFDVASLLAPDNQPTAGTAVTTATETEPMKASPFIELFGYMNEMVDTVSVPETIGTPILTTADEDGEQEDIDVEVMAGTDSNSDDLVDEDSFSSCSLPKHCPLLLQYNQSAVGAIELLEGSRETTTKLMQRSSRPITTGGEISKYIEVGASGNLFDATVRPSKSTRQMAVANDGHLGNSPITETTASAKTQTKLQNSISHGSGYS